MNRGIVIESWPHCFGCILAPRTAIDIVNLWLAGKQASGKWSSYHGMLLIGMLSLSLLCCISVYEPILFMKVVWKSLK